MSDRGEITLPLDEARILFDTAVNTMDFGSGFLDDEEVAALRSFAVRLGLDPMLATPGNFAIKYPHPWSESAAPWRRERGECGLCHAERDHAVHQ